MRTTPIGVGEYYHLYNRGAKKQLLFHDARDYARFIFLIVYFQSPITFANIGRKVTSFVQHSVFNIEEDEIANICKSRFVELVSFCCMPNHFHLIIKEAEEGGIATYMQRVLNAYAKYYNARYEKSGHVFQGPYKAVHQENNNQLLHLSAYIHHNPRELPKWKNKEANYLWSSYQDYTVKNRWGDLLLHDIIVSQFDSKKSYEHFLKTSPAKTKELI